MKIQNKMKKLVIIFILTLAPMVAFSQSIFEKYEDMNDVSTVVVTKHLFQLLNKVSGDSPEGKEYKDMISGLDNLTVYSIESESLALKMQKDVKSFLKSSKMVELVRVKDKEANVKIYIREGKDEDHVRELFMFINSLKTVKMDGRNPKAIVLSLTGDIDLKNIDKIIDKLNIPGGEQLKKATH